MDDNQRKSIDIAMRLIRETGTCAISEDIFAALHAENSQLRSLAYEALHVMENLKFNGPQQGDGFWDEEGSGGWCPGEDVRDRLRLAARLDDDRTDP